ncbi:hypothetical protein [Duck adenovirus 1]|uniref:Uncharacterized protein n=1 Tax=Duck adenovirus 1 TaxID=130329 RepID=A0A6B9EV36_DADV1|nr:hypothetical protein [Duck adenovirus 1]
MILLQLPSRSIAAAAIAIPPWKPLLKTRGFLKKHIRRFKKISENIPLAVYLKEMEMYNYATECVPTDVCKETLRRTQSNHCFHCLLQPHILCEPMSVAQCSCIDHLWLAGCGDVVLWGNLRWWALEKQPWPIGFSPVLSASETAKKLEKMSQRKLGAINCDLDDDNCEIS